MSVDFDAMARQSADLRTQVNLSDAVSTKGSHMDTAEANKAREPKDADIEAAKTAGKVDRVFEIISNGTDWDLPNIHVLVRMPRRIELQRWQTQVQDESRRLIAGENLLSAVLCWPAADTLKTQIDERPGALTAIVSELLDLVGMRSGEKKAR